MFSFKIATIVIVSVWLLIPAAALSQTMQWEAAGSPNQGSAVSALVISSNGKLFAKTTGTATGLYRSADRGSSWTPITGVSISSADPIAVSSPTRTVFIAKYDSVARSVDDGATWTARPYGAVTTGAMNLASAPDGSLWMGTPVGGVFKSMDDGITWTGASTGLTQYSIYAFAFRITGAVFASSYSGAVYRSSIKGAAWTPVPISYSVSGGNFDVNAMAAQSDNNLYAAGAAGICRSSDNGSTWTSVNKTLSVRALCMNTRQHIFASTPTGIYRSTDNGDTWTAYTSGLADKNVTSLALGSDGRLYAGTNSGVVYRTIESTLAVDEQTSGLPARFTLEQNYPNPFNPSTTISFGLAARTHVSLKVFDIMGREVATLVSEEMAAGYYSRHWNASEMPSGVYFYRLQADSYMETKRLTLVK